MTTKILPECLSTEGGCHYIYALHRELCANQGGNSSGNLRLQILVIFVERMNEDSLTFFV